MSWSIESLDKASTRVTLMSDEEHPNVLMMKMISIRYSMGRRFEGVQLLDFQCKR